MIEKLETDTRPAQWQLEEKINEIIDAVNRQEEAIKYLAAINEGKLETVKNILEPKQN